jgi:hypothetical protein
MPYIRGRYYMNPVVGDALEAAREAEAALQALEHAAKVARGDTGEDDPGSSNSSGSGNGASGSSNASGSDANSSADAYAKAAPGPIHRVEIEAAELVPAHSGRAQRGFVARIHRRANGNAANAAGDAGVRTAGVPPAQSPSGSNSPFASNSSKQQSAMRSAPETHVFSNHNDLTNFLHDQFAEDSK